MGRPSRQAQHTAPDWARRLQGDRGQAWPSCALTLHGCPLTLWVGGPSRLSLTLPVPARFFQSLCLVLSISKSLSLFCLSAALGFNVSLLLTLLFFPLISLSFVPLFPFCYCHLWSTAQLTCLQGKLHLLFPALVSFPPSLSLLPSLPVLCPAVALEGSVYPAAAEAGFICPRASLWKGIFCLWRIAHCPRWHWVLNCATSKFGSHVL